MLDDGDRILDIVAIGLAVAVAGALGIVFLAAVNAPGAQSAAAPEANWTVERTNATHVRIAHAGGEPVRADHLAVAVNGTERAVAWPEVIVEGDAGVVRARDGEVVELYWSADRERRVRLASWRP